MQGLVFDDDLRALMQKDVEQSIQALENYRKFINVPLKLLPQNRLTPIIN